jgi:hypothetical protein
MSCALANAGKTIFAQFTKAAFIAAFTRSTKFAENLPFSPFNKDLSNETTFSLIHLA